MIAFLRGSIAVKSPTEILLDVNGIGYRIFISLQTHDHIPGTGEICQLETEFIVREDGHYLYGFAGKAEHSLFKHLVSVSGVGPKIAISILSSLKPEDLAHHIASANVRILKTIPGVGQKMAERLIVELKDKVSKLTAPADASWLSGSGNQAQDDAIAALTALGFSRQVAEKSIATIVKTTQEPLKTEDMIRLALRQTVK
ncbi:MAG: Holliday junction branch migration protein RuvA [Bacteroidetes bacterium]|nr:Holliday junction branch migration protein RuvA [Bacteroidota bacterium]